MNFPWARHYQRYEHAIQRGWLTQKTVADVGCGCFPLGAYAISTTAKMVFAIDPYVNKIGGVKFVDGNGYGTFIVRDATRIICIAEDVYDFVGHVDVAIAVEVFEHMANPVSFIKHLSKMCDWAFITTPMAIDTWRTSNPWHVAEYSKKDFEFLVGMGFDIIERKYQTGDMRILDEAQSAGCDSTCNAHIDQMVWARSKHAKE